jgi:hypothetical protein
MVCNSIPLPQPLLFIINNCYCLKHGINVKHVRCLEMLIQHSSHSHCLQGYALGILGAAYITPTATAAVTAAGPAARQDSHNWGRVGC